MRAGVYGGLSNACLRQDRLARQVRCASPRHAADRFLTEQGILRRSEVCSAVRQPGILAKTACCVSVCRLAAKRAGKTESARHVGRDRVQALLAGFFLNACQYKTTEYDRLKADDRGTHVYTMLRAAHAPQAGGGTATARLAVDSSSVLAHVRPQWLVFASCQQTSEGLWRMSDVIATDAEALAAAAPHVFERTPQTMR